MGYLHRLLSGLLNGSEQDRVGSSHGECAVGDGFFDRAVPTGHPLYFRASNPGMSEGKTTGTDQEVASLASYISTDPDVRKAVRAILDSGYGYRLWWEKVEADNGSCYLVHVLAYDPVYDSYAPKTEDFLSRTYLWTPPNS